jgi:hypothetical protein
MAGQGDGDGNDRIAKMMGGGGTALRLSQGDLHLISVSTTGPDCCASCTSSRDFRRLRIET